MPIAGKPLNSVSEICHTTLDCRIDVGSPVPTGRKRCLLYGKIRGKRTVGKRSAMMLIPEFFVNCS